MRMAFDPSRDRDTWQRAEEATRQGDVLVDRFGRSKRKLRLSLTDRCNFRCGYCMPEDPEWTPRHELLSFEELLGIAQLFVSRMGVTNIRLTGGEPLVRRGVPAFIERLNELRPLGLERISMTSNASLLDRHAAALVKAGLDDVNISIDSIDPERFRQMTGGGELEPVLRGIRATRDAGLSMKLNAVAIRGENEDDVVPLTQWAMGEGISLRFIEFMPLDARGGWQPNKVFTEDEIITALKQHFIVEQLPRTREPATYYRMDGDYRLGIISTISNPFCGSCDRVRVTSTGEIYPCLFSPVCTDLKTPLRSGASREELEQTIRGAVWRKGRGFVESRGYVERAISMHGLGG
ncbi:GTP 3',8-cyclase MoaA [Nitrococcus mobilis]|uniref:GTP 3',8-cyclase n=1 Tax=Nitrococcus mobilis Nb-231 TaxID=314278 RepID=A4BPZ7_9GAMM|nr:GTP 3',8-cyclase MoaA [Nitrococcus mobilis]EAR22152.1 molybdopterin biosynthesis, protein A [Nitrococcus mobilis Nb-231]